MKSIGIFGGTFNPIHIGHLIAAQEVLDKMKLDRIIFMPANNPPHKENINVVNSEDRFNMVNIAVKDNPKFIVSDMELKRDGTTYTYDTIIELNKIYKESNIYLILGFDAFKYTDHWKNANDVFKLTSFIVVNRENNIMEMDREIQCKEDKYGAHIHVVNIPDINISSTEIRKRIKNKESIKYLVTADVEEYIKSNLLYKGDDINDELYRY